MQHSQDVVWNTITDSAKTKFDYQSFEKTFLETGSGQLPENILFMTIAGHAAGHSTDEIVSEINGELALLDIGLTEADLRRFVTERKIELKSEIRAAAVAFALFEQGRETPGVLVQVRSILGTPLS